MVSTEFTYCVNIKVMFVYFLPGSELQQVETLINKTFRKEITDKMKHHLIQTNKLQEFVIISLSAVNMFTQSHGSKHVEMYMYILYIRSQSLFIDIHALVSFLYFKLNQRIRVAYVKSTISNGCTMELVSFDYPYLSIARWPEVVCVIEKLYHEVFSCKTLWQYSQKVPAKT